jgi:hypothetical protein
VEYNKCQPRGSGLLHLLYSGLILVLVLLLVERTGLTSHNDTPIAI